MSWLGRGDLTEMRNPLLKGGEGEMQMSVQLFLHATNGLTNCFLLYFFFHLANDPPVSIRGYLEFDECQLCVSRGRCQSYAIVAAR